MPAHPAGLPATELPAAGFYRRPLYDMARPPSRVHVTRPGAGSVPDMYRGECGYWPGRQHSAMSDLVLLDALPAALPAGLAWCPKCVGLALARTGQLAAAAAFLLERRNT